MERLCALVPKPPKHLLTFHEKAVSSSFRSSSWTAKKRHRPPCFHPHSGGPVQIRCMLGSVQPGTAIYHSISRASGEAREDLETRRSYPDWAVDV